MLELRKRFIKNGIDYIFKSEHENGYIYSCLQNDKEVGYIAFEKKLTKGHPMSENPEELRPRTPSDESFGHWSWQCFTYDDAIKRLNNIIKKPKESE